MGYKSYHILDKIIGVLEVKKMYRIFDYNPQLMPYQGDIDYRMHLYHDTKWKLVGDRMSLCDFANAHEYLGIHHVDGGWIYREWAPNAHQLYLTGEFNDWHWLDHPMKRLDNGVLSATASYDHYFHIKISPFKNLGRNVFSGGTISFL